MSNFIETEIGLFPTHWSVSSVLNEAEVVTDYVANGSFASLKENVSYKSTVDYAILIRMVDFSRGFKGDFVYVDEKSYKFLKKSKLLGGEIIISNVGEYAGTVFRVPTLKSPMTLGPNSIMVKFKEGNDFYYYFFKSPAGQDLIQSIRTGSAIPKFNKTDFRNLKIPVLPLQEKEGISEILSSLDYKIDLLHQNNKTLEQLAETLFRQWFVEEVKEEWSEVKLGSYISLVSGYSYRSVDLNNSTKALVTLKNFERTGGFRHDGFKEYTGKYKDDQVVVSGDLIVAHTDITQDAEVLGNPAIVISSSKYETLIISTDLVKVVPTSYLSKVYLYFLMKTDEFKHYCLGNSNGTTVLHLSKKALPGFDLKLPPSLLVNKFTAIAEPLLEKKNNNQKLIQQLENLRDTLMPKLMSGLVRVEN